MEATAKRRQPGIQSVRRAVAVLQALSAAGRLGVAELGDQVGLSKTTVYGIVRTLALDGLVERDRDSGKYQLGASVLPMGFRYLEADTLRSAALNGAHELAARSRESVRVAKLHDGQVLIVHQVPRPDGGQQASDIGSLVPAHASALGKVMLAQHGELIAAQIEAASLRRFTPATVTNVADLRRELALTASRGWASELGELTGGVASIAAPIAVGSDRTPAAVDVEGSAERIFADGTPRGDLVRAVIGSARTISRELGAPPWLR